jgi:hypothetical protein
MRCAGPGARTSSHGPGMVSRPQPRPCGLGCRLNGPGHVGALRGSTLATSRFTRIKRIAWSSAERMPGGSQSGLRHARTPILANRSHQVCWLHSGRRTGRPPSPPRRPYGARLKLSGHATVSGPPNAWAAARPRGRAGHRRPNRAGHRRPNQAGRRPNQASRRRATRESRVPEPAHR